MRGLAYLAGLTALLWAQAYRPFVFTPGVAIPVQRWRQRQGPFPEVGYINHGLDLSLAKQYYGPTGRIGWFLFGRGVDWKPHNRFLGALLQAPPLDTQIVLHNPQSIQGGVGIVFRHVWQNWILTLPIDVHIIGLRYPIYEVPLENGELFQAKIGTNSFLGIGFGLSLQRPISNPRFFETWGASVYFPLFTGAPSVFTRLYKGADGSQRIEQGNYYLPPTHISVRLAFDFRL